MADKVRVSVPGGGTTTFKPHSSSKLVIEYLRGLYGAGDLFDWEGDAVIQEELCAGNYSYTLLSDPDESTVTRAILKQCEDFVGSIRGELASIPRDPSAYKRRFPNALVDVMSNGPPNTETGSPYLLWDDIPKEIQLESFWVESAPGPSQLFVFLAPSGAGKTRQLIELGSEHNCLFLVGKKAHQAGSQFQGSLDIAMVARRLGQLYPDEAEPIDGAAVDCCVSALVLARLYILDELLRLYPAMTCRDWCFFQLEYTSRVKDVFRMLTSKLLKKFVNREVLEVSSIALAGAIGTLRTALKTSAGAYEQWNGVVILDEAQIVNKLLEGRFDAKDHPGRKRSLLHSLLAALKDVSLAKSLYIAGTGESMLNILEQAEESGTLKEFKKKEVPSLSTFDKLEEMNVYVSHYIDVSHINMHEVFERFQGRPRFIVSALQCYMALENRAGTEFFINFAHEIATKKAEELQLLHSVRDDVDKFMHRYDEGRILRNVALTAYEAGVAAFLKLTQQTGKLLDCSLGQMIKSNDMEKEQGYLMPTMASPEFRRDYGCVMIREPIVKYAILHAIPEGDRISDLLSQQRDPSAFGLKFETVTCSGIAAYFRQHQTYPLSTLPKLRTTVGSLPAVYDEPCRLLEYTDNALIRTITLSYGLSEWLRDHECCTAATFLHFGPKGNLAGPDKLCLLKGTVTGKIFPVLIQDKTGDVRMDEAFMSVDVRQFYRYPQKNPSLASAVKKVQNWCLDGYIQVLMTTMNHNIQDRLLAYIDSVRKEDPPVPPLRAAIDKWNVDMFESEELMFVVGTVKATQAMQRVICQGSWKNGSPCKYKVSSGGKYCKRHAKP